MFAKFMASKKASRKGDKVSHKEAHGHSEPVHARRLDREEDSDDGGNADLTKQILAKAQSRMERGKESKKGGSYILEAATFGSAGARKGMAQAGARFGHFTAESSKDGSEEGELREDGDELEDGELAEDKDTKDKGSTKGKKGKARVRVGVPQNLGNIESVDVEDGDKMENGSRSVKRSKKEKAKFRVSEDQEEGVGQQVEGEDGSGEPESSDTEKEEREEGEVEEEATEKNETQGSVVKKKKKKKKAKKKKKNQQQNETEKAAALEGGVVVAVGTTAKGQQHSLEAPDAAGPLPDGNSAEDNIEMRRLLRGTRYFTPVEEQQQQPLCFNCGESGHMARDCTASASIRPCFVCGLRGHGGKECPQRVQCYVCHKMGHIARDCPGKDAPTDGDERLAESVCLRCGGGGHEAAKCWRGYDAEDLERVQCYVCHETGHLCCAQILMEPAESITCYSCGEAGHSGEGCARPRGPPRDGDQRPAQTCYICGEEGHFARGCSQANQRRGSWPPGPDFTRRRQMPYLPRTYEDEEEDYGRAMFEQRSYVPSLPQKWRGPDRGREDDRRPTGDYRDYEDDFFIQEAERQSGQRRGKGQRKSTGGGGSIVRRGDWARGGGEKGRKDNGRNDGWDGSAANGMFKGGGWEGRPSVARGGDGGYDEIGKERDRHSVEKSRKRKSSPMPRHEGGRRHKRWE